ncbi:MAG: hypothetical protein F6K10_37095 [Moorea sp. SIO2B7]|nr:hypothetical protein [Moorena sp. SIO2B7]
MNKINNLNKQLESNLEKYLTDQVKNYLSQSINTISNQIKEQWEAHLPGEWTWGGPSAYSVL